jgi:hypothetical protein
VAAGEGVFNVNCTAVFTTFFRLNACDEFLAQSRDSTCEQHQGYERMIHGHPSGKNVGTGSSGLFHSPCLAARMLFSSTPVCAPRLLDSQPEPLRGFQAYQGDRTHCVVAFSVLNGISSIVRSPMQKMRLQHTAGADMICGLSFFAC